MNRYLQILLLICLKLFLNGQVDSGLVAKYYFNEGNAKDDIGNTEAKVIGASPVEDRFGNLKSAYRLQGNYESYLNLGTSDVLKPSTITISLWMQIDRFVHKGRGAPNNPIIITKSHSGNDFMEAYTIGVESTRKINVNSANDSIQGVGITSADTVSDLKWHHVVLAFNDKYMWFYLDGIMQNGSKPIIKNFKTKFLSGDSVIIGSTANIKNSRCFAGNIDDIRFYNRVISSDEVYELYKESDPNKNRIYLLLFYRGIALLFIMACIIWLVTRRYKNALEKEKEKNRINMRLIELETKAIRTQMNPHFMFNSLNTLQRFILEEDISGAREYLAKFAKLLRKTLESSVSDTISLAEEIDILESYLELEKLRFDNSFMFSITSIVLHPENTYIPFMMVQPFVENAVWHGLLPMKGSRLLTVIFSDLTEKTLICIVEDNGVGRESSAMQKDPLKKKSLAIDFIKQRLELLEKSLDTKYAIQIIDKKNNNGQSEGTRVEISIPKLSR